MAEGHLQPGHQPYFLLYCNHIHKNIVFGSTVSRTIANFRGIFPYHLGKVSDSSIRIFGAACVVVMKLGLIIPVLNSRFQ